MEENEETVRSKSNGLCKSGVRSFRPNVLDTSGKDFFFSWLLLRKIEGALYNNEGDCLVVFSSPIGIKDSNEAEL